ncbi:MAG TPA: TonB-dependent receptor plug domain-containing protein [Gemmatimonadales bacterium]
MTRARAALAGLARAAACIHPHPMAPSAENAGDRIVITQEMIERSGGLTAWDVLKKEAPQLTYRENSHGQPSRLERRGQSSMVLSDAPMVYVDGSRLSDFRSLQQIMAATLRRIEILNAIDGTTYYGTDAEGGVILLFTKSSSGN